MNRFVKYGGLVATGLLPGLLLSGLLSVPQPGAAATVAASEWVDTGHASIRLISATDTASTINPEEPLRLGLEFRLRDDWKIYWRSPGDAGYPPRADWSGSTNVRDVGFLWPAPVRFSVLGLETIGYRDEVVLPLSVRPEVPGQPVRLGGTIDYLVCSDICIPETLTLAINLPSGPVAPSLFAHLIDTYEARVPRPGNGNGLTIDSLNLRDLPENGKELVITAHAATGMPFENPDAFLEGPSGAPASVGYGKPEVTLDPPKTTATLRVPVIGPSAARAALAGESFTVTLVDGARSVEFTGAVSPANPAADGAMLSAAAPPSLATMLVLALLGGFILNFMPCVLPVLSVKVLGVVGQGSGDRRDVRIGFLASAAGIITSFLILAAALSALKVSGAAIGWGVQFQHPWFLTAMALIIAVFACNLWGWFEFRLPGAVSGAVSDVAGDFAMTIMPARGTAGKRATGQGATSQGVAGHFMTGMLATLLATPCSAPFLGTAVGFALARGTAEIMVIFVVLGLGLAAPYLLVAAAPGIAAAMPRPGSWMIVLRRVLGILLAGTVGWLLSVLLAQTGGPATALTGGAILLSGTTIYLYHRGAFSRRLTGAVVLSGCVAAFTAPYVIGQSGFSGARQADAIDGLWQPFDTNAIAARVAGGGVVFVDVTAEWCVTCRVNKSLVLARGEVFKRLSSEHVTPMQGDWTLPDHAITAYLSRHGRYGVPFNAVYGPGTPEGVVLPEILTPDSVMDALRQAAAPRGG